MANDVEIVVTGRDRTDSAFGSAIRKAKNLGDTAGSHIKRGFDGASKDSTKSVFGIGTALDVMRGKTEGVAAGAKLLANPYIAAGAAVGGMAAGALASGVALAGLGAGFIAVGAMGVRESAKVNAALGSLKDTANKVITDAAKPLENNFANALMTLRGTVSSTGPMLRSVFDKVGPSIEHMADGVDGLARNAMPGLERAGKASAKVLDTLARKLPETGDAISALGDDLAGAADGGAQAMSDSLTLVNATLGQTGNALKATGEAYDFFRNGMGKWTTGVIGTLLDVNDGQKKVGKSAQEAAASGEAEAEAYFKVARGLGDADIKGRELLTTFENFNGPAVDMARANIAVADSARDAADALKESKGSIDLSTEAGARAHETLLTLTDDYKGQLQVMRNAGKGSEEIEARYRAQVGELRALGRRYNMTEQQIDDFIAKTFSIPTSVKVNITTPRLQGTKQQVQGFKREADKIKGQYTALVKVHGDAAAAGTINTLKRKAEALDGQYYIDIITREHRKVYSTTASYRYGSADAASRWGSAHGGIVPGIPGAANGGIRNGLMMVGEYGRELVELPPGSRVHPNGTTEAMMSAAAAGGGGASRVVIDLTGGDNEFLRWLRNRIRIEGGGNVQAALGK